MIWKCFPRTWRLVMEDHWRKLIGKPWHPYDVTVMVHWQNHAHTRVYTHAQYIQIYVYVYWALVTQVSHHLTWYWSYWPESIRSSSHGLTHYPRSHVVFIKAMWSLLWSALPHVGYDLDSVTLLPHVGNIARAYMASHSRLVLPSYSLECNRVTTAESSSLSNTTATCVFTFFMHAVSNQNACVTDVLF